MQRNDVWLVKQDYSKENSVTRILHELGRQNQQDRSKDVRLKMLYKIINEITNVPN